mgnify:CR=1 FL=1
MSSVVDHPAHYMGDGIEAIDVIEQYGLGMHLGNAMKYLLRAGRKGEAATDRAKAGWYMGRWLDGLHRRHGIELPIASSAQQALSTRPLVSEADMARAAKSQPVITDQDIERAATKNRMPSEAELARVPVPATPKLDALPQPLAQRPIDLGAIAKGFEAMGQPAPGAAAINAGPTLLVFVSFPMPDALSLIHI